MLGVGDIGMTTEQPPCASQWNSLAVLCTSCGLIFPLEYQAFVKLNNRIPEFFAMRSLWILLQHIPPNGTIASLLGCTARVNLAFPGTIFSPQKSPFCLLAFVTKTLGSLGFIALLTTVCFKLQCLPFYSKAAARRRFMLSRNQAGQFSLGSVLLIRLEKNHGTE